MAAGNVVVYMSALRTGQLGSHNFASNTFVVHLVSHGYTPNFASHSNWATDVSAYELTTSGYAARNLAGQAVSQPSNSHIRFDADDITFSAAATMTAKYAVIEKQADNALICIVDLETGATSGVDATQIVTQWNASGLYQFNNPAA